jgi:exosortase/archaeosortase family protein
MWSPGPLTRDRPATRSFVLKAALWMLLLCAAFYYPYAPASWPSHAIGAYLRLIARASGWLIARFEPGVIVDGTTIGGAFPLEIVKACSALDAQALYAAAALAFPAPRGRKLAGLALGIALLTLLNIARIACLYLVGLHAPLHFDTVHEEWLPAALVLAAGLCFAGWARWVVLHDDSATRAA